MTLLRESRINKSQSLRAVFPAHPPFGKRIMSSLPFCCGFVSSHNCVRSTLWATVNYGWSFASCSANCCGFYHHIGVRVICCLDEHICILKR